MVGGPDTGGKGLAELLDSTRPDELMISTNVGGPAARLRSYRLVKEIFDAW